MKKIYRTGFLLLSFILMGFIFGCERKEPVENKKAVIRYSNWEVLPEQLALHGEVVDAFNKSQDKILVKFEAVQGGPDKIKVELAGGAAPDVFYWCDSILPPLARAKAVIDLVPFIKADNFDLSIYFPKVIDAMRYNEAIYGLPVYLGSSALAYNKSLFDKEGLNYPDEEWTWTDFLESAKRLTKKENDRIIQFGANRPHPIGVMVSFGGGLFEPMSDGKPAFVLDTKESKDALQFLLDLQNTYHVIPTDRDMAGMGAGTGGLAGIGGPAYLFMAGKLSMYFVPAATLPMLNKIKEFEWDVAPLPECKGREKKVKSFGAGSGILCISSQSRYPRESWEFVKFACGVKGISIIGKGRNCVPAIPDIAYSVFAVPPPEHIRVFVDAIDYDEVAPVPVWLEEFLNKVFWPEMDVLFLGQQSIDETIRKIEAEAGKYYKDAN